MRAHTSTAWIGALALSMALTSTTAHAEDRAPRWRQPAPGNVRLGLGFPTVGELGIGIRGASALEIEVTAAAITARHRPGIYGLVGLNADLMRWSTGTSVLLAGLRGGRSLLSISGCLDSEPQQCSPHEGWLVEPSLGYAYRFSWGEWRVQGFVQTIFWDKPDQYDAARRTFAAYNPDLLTFDLGVRTSVAFGIW